MALFTRAVWPAAAILFMAVPLGAEALGFETIAAQEKTPLTAVQAIFQDDRGFMWFGTQDGLYRFDGYDLVGYTNDPDDPNSLSDSWIASITEGRSGVLWIGTSGGLNALDPATGRITRYRHDPSDPASLAEDAIIRIVDDSSGRLWVATQNVGLDRFDPSTGRFEHHRHDPRDPGSLSDDHVMAVFEDGQHRLWVGTAGGGLDRLDPDTGRFLHYRHDPADPTSLSSDDVMYICGARDGRLWVGTNGGGLNLFDPGKGTFTRYRNAPSDPRSLSSDRVQVVLVDARGSVWVGTNGGGLNRLERETGSFQRFQHDPGDPRSLNHNAVMALYQGRSGILWVGTLEGVATLDSRRHRFPLYRHDPANPASLSDNFVRVLYQDHSGTLWVGTHGGGLNRLVSPPGSSGKAVFRHYRHDPGNPKTISHDDVWALLEDSRGRFWIGTSGGLDRWDPARGVVIKSYRHDPQDPNSLSSDRILCLAEDRSGLLWIGTIDEGLNSFDPATGRVRRYQHDPARPDSLGRGAVRDIHQARDGTLWIGSWNGGLDKYQPETGTFVRYQNDPSDPSSYRGGGALSIHEDDSGILWVASNGGGLNRFDPRTGKFQHFTKKDGLADDYVYSVLADDEGRLWMSTNRGLSRFDPRTRTFRNYDVRDGLQGNEFNSGAYFRGSDGRLYFGGMNGFNAFDPAAVVDNPYLPPVVLTDFRVFNRPVSVGRSGESPLRRTIAAAATVELSYRDSFFSFGFSGLNYTLPEKNRYAFKMEGFNQSWVETTADHRVATYTNLDPGEYVFRVKASNNDGVWSPAIASIRVRIEPPPWRTWWAYLLYLGVGVSIVGWFVHTERSKVARKHQEWVREKQIAEKLRRADKLKDEFLANTSHELRTPLHGIIGIAESLRDGVTGELAPSTKGNLSMIISSGRRLEVLVDDILDLSRLKNRALTLSRHPVDVRSLTDVILTLSRPLVRPKAVALVNEIPEGLPFVDADEDRLQQIMHNLIGNAVKFTEQGTVKVTAERREGMLAVSVSDTGIGIRPEDRERIFEAFEQAEGDTTRLYGGTGLGLAVTRHLVGLHGGTIEVSSAPGEGSTFTFTLPIAGGAATPAPPSTRVAKVRVLEGISDEGELIPPAGVESGTGEELGFKLLIVDDDAVNRQVLLNQLSLQRYEIIQAASGEEALTKVEEESPDLILLDIMMPRMSGYEVCRRLRASRSAAQMPVIYLTAKDRAADLVEAFHTGGNDYLTKPITKEELLVRVKTHLDLLDVNRNLERRVAERTEELSKANAQLERLASLDGLTRIPNRRIFDETLPRVWADHRRRGAELAILLADLDHFKRYNDTKGHQQGDAALVAVATALQRSLRRATDLVARYGGEEFVMVLPDTPAAEASAMAERVRQAVLGLEIEYQASEIHPCLTISTGVASVVPSKSGTAAALIEAADAALYRAKESGRNRVVVATPRDDALPGSGRGPR